MFWVGWLRLCVGVDCDVILIYKRVGRVEVVWK